MAIKKEGECMIRKIIINISVLVFLISNTSFADIKFWTTEVQPARMAKQEEMAKAFEAKTASKLKLYQLKKKILAQELLQLQQREIFQM